MAVLSNLRRRLPPLAYLTLACLTLTCLALVLAGCAGSHGITAPAGNAHAADRRLVPPDLFWTMPDGARLPVRVWRTAGVRTRALVLALHGFNDSRDAWELPGPDLAAAGIALYAPDQRGFGEAPGRGGWPGADRMVDDAATMVRGLELLHPGLPVYVMGESMGGAVALCLAARPDHPPVAGFMLLAPAVWSSAEMSPLLTVSLWAASAFAPRWQVTGRELPVHLVASDNLAALYRLSYDPLTLRSTRIAVLRGLVQLMTRAEAAAPHVRGRVLIAYGAHDQLVPATAMAAAWALLPRGVRRAYYPHGFHLLLRDRDRHDVIGDLVSWIASPGAALPSGADTAAAAWIAGGFWETQVPAALPANLDSLAGGD